ncbi:Flavodoxin [Streptomyces sp. BpilaLS-43]|uniref:flavodoxin n=1 Tax=Streptomyces sp. BpilaLS-43 TaxID=1839778 RepID=UPI00081B5C73|nr:flavodoxin [Streptomyces sp. BpilaLS-43]SCD80760.1 Flavodoxin [Streptomyces sp. BpilaLS-43]
MTSITRRNLLALATATLAGTAVAGCSIVGGADSSEEAAPKKMTPPQDESRILVAYFSVPETDDPDGMSEDEENSTHVVDGNVLGNTQYVAQIISRRTGAEVFRIETAEQLPLDHDTLEDLALKQQEAGERPKLKSPIRNLEDYDTVFVGYPIWWYELPMPMHTFFEGHDFSGKNVIPFSTHGGNGLSGTVETITETVSDSAIVGNAFTISRDDMGDAEAEVGDWLERIGMARK